MVKPGRLPLGAEIQRQYRKVIFLDVGLCTRALGLSLHDVETTDAINFINRGGLAEQVVGQTLRTLGPPYREPALYYWHRDEKGSEAEVDYVVQHQNQVIPVEVKAGTSGGLKSLHYFMQTKQREIAVRVNAGTPSRMPVTVRDYAGRTIQYTLLSMPFYLLGQLHRLVGQS